jgi:hypothetical protein
MVNAGILQVAENLVENTVHSAVSHAWKGSNTDAMATECPSPAKEIMALQEFIRRVAEAMV